METKRVCSCGKPAVKTIDPLNQPGAALKVVGSAYRKLKPNFPDKHYCLSCWAQLPLKKAKKIRA